MLFIPTAIVPVLVITSPAVLLYIPIPGFDEFNESPILIVPILFIDFIPVPSACIPLALSPLKSISPAFVTVPALEVFRYIPTVSGELPFITPLIVLVTLSVSFPYIPTEFAPAVTAPELVNDDPVPFVFIPSELFPTVIFPEFSSLVPFFPYNPAELSPSVIFPLFSPSVSGINPAGSVPIY